MKDLLYAEQQKLIEDDMLPAGVFGEQRDDDTFVDSTGTRWYSE